MNENNAENLKNAGHPLHSEGPAAPPNRSADGGTRRKNSILIPTLIMAAVAAILFFIAFKKGDGSHLKGLSLGIKTMIEITPLLLFAFAVAGLMQVIIPKEIISGWLGNSSGIKGIFIGSVAGGLMPGGPHVVFPVAAGFLGTGASVPTMVAFMTGWAVWNVHKLPLSVGILGWKFTFAVFAATLVFPPLAGILAKIFIQTSAK